MDSSKQLYEHEAEGWKLGVYHDIKATFNAPIINWVFRSLMANEPTFTRYLWGQVKPDFKTKEFASFESTYRDTILSAVEKASDVPSYQPGDLGISPGEFRELRRQLQTFDSVAPRLALFFEVTYRGLHDDLAMTAPRDAPSSTAPYTHEKTEQGGWSPTLIEPTSIPKELSGTIDSVQEFHGIEHGIPSIHRCLAQWPEVLQCFWQDLSPVLSGHGFETAKEETSSLLSTHAASLGYYPNITPNGLGAIGFEQTTINDVTEFIDGFYHGPADTVLLTLPLYAAVVNAGGRRSFP